MRTLVKWDFTKKLTNLYSYFGLFEFYLVIRSSLSFIWDFEIFPINGLSTVYEPNSWSKSINTLFYTKQMDY